MLVNARLDMFQMNKDDSGKEVRGVIVVMQGLGWYKILALHVRKLIQDIRRPQVRTIHDRSPNALQAELWKRVSSVRDV